MTGPSTKEFDTLAEDIVPLLIADLDARRDRPRRNHAVRVGAVAGLVYRQLRHQVAC